MWVDGAKLIFSMSDRGHILFIDEIPGFESKDEEEFDRIEFAMRVLGTLRPRKLSVAVYPGHDRLRVESVRDLRGEEGSRWAFVGIPPHASRANIAHALADLAGVANVPYAIDVLMNADRS